MWRRHGSPGSPEANSGPSTLTGVLRVQTYIGFEHERTAPWRGKRVGSRRDQIGAPSWVTARHSCGSSLRRSAATLPPTSTGSARDGKGWIEGNTVRPLVHGSTYFRRLYEELSILRAGDRVYFTDWRGDADERLLPGGPTVGDLLRDLATAGVQIRALLWRSHSDHVNLSSRENQRLGVELNAPGPRCCSTSGYRGSARTTRSCSSSGTVVTAGAMWPSSAGSICATAVATTRLTSAIRSSSRWIGGTGRRAPWHDAALELRGPVVGDLLRTFVERWDDPHPLDHRNPYRWVVHRRARMPRHPEPLPEAFPDPAPAGSHAVQLLRTYGPKHPPYPFAPRRRTQRRARLRQGVRAGLQPHLRRGPVPVVGPGGRRPVRGARPLAAAAGDRRGAPLP